MSQQLAITVLVETLTAVSEYDNLLNPIYDQLRSQRPLTLRAIRQQTQLLHDHAGLAHEQTFAINRVIVSCKQIPPTPLPEIPFRF